MGCAVVVLVGFFLVGVLVLDVSVLVDEPGVAADFGVLVLVGFGVVLVVDFVFAVGFFVVVGFFVNGDGPFVVVVVVVVNPVGVSVVVGCADP